MGEVIDMTERLPHGAHYVACMVCAHDWVAVVPERGSWPLECPKCGGASGENVAFSDVEWFKRFMTGENYHKRMMVLLNAKRITQQEGKADG